MRNFPGYLIGSGRPPGVGAGCDGDARELLRRYPPGEPLVLPAASATDSPASVSGGAGQLRAGPGIALKMPRAVRVVGNTMAYVTVSSPALPGAQGHGKVLK
jgi:hypothetical protein